MHSILYDKIKEAAVSVLPVMGLVVVLHFTLAPLPEGFLARYLVGGTILILGLAIFLVGADIGMVPFGQRVGSALTLKRNLPLLLVTSFVIGFAITIAEPDVQVLATNVANVAPDIDKTLLLVMIAVGVGIFLVVAMARIVFQLSLPILLTVFYGLVFLACAFVDSIFVGVAFDAGGATTGPITVPFIMAMGIGVAAATRRKEDNDGDSFGFVGLASIGPIAAVAVLGLFSSITTAVEEAAPAEEVPGLFAGFWAVVPHVLQNTVVALAPIVVIFFIFQFTLLKLPSGQVRRITMGFVYTFIGLVLFLVGVEGGFTPVGAELGRTLAGVGGGWVLIPVGLVLGAVVVCAEPAVWVLNEQVEEVSGGHIRRRIMLVALSVSIALAVTLGMVRVLTGISIWWMLVPGYALALGLTRFTPKLFTAIAFDSGGVASGPMSTTFVMALALGAAEAIPGRNPATDALGIVAMIAMAPLITIQILGLLYQRKEAMQAARIEAREEGEAS